MSLGFGFGVGEGTLDINERTRVKVVVESMRDTHNLGNLGKFIPTLDSESPARCTPCSPTSKHLGALEKMKDGQ